MTSNLASDEIAEYGIQLREEADKITKQRYEGQPEDLEIMETITISRRFEECLSFSCMQSCMQFGLMWTEKQMFGKVTYH